MDDTQGVMPNILDSPPGGVINCSQVCFSLCSFVHFCTMYSLIYFGSRRSLYEVTLRWFQTNVWMFIQTRSVLTTKYRLRIRDMLWQSIKIRIIRDAVLCYVFADCQDQVSLPFDDVSGIGKSYDFWGSFVDCGVIVLGTLRIDAQW